jgi:hypothetical protein
VSSRQVGLDVVYGLTTGSFEEVHDKGFHWLFSVLIPAVDAVEPAALRSPPESRAREACSLACYLVGDILETHSAPRVAITWYQRALALWPNDASAWREIGTCQSEMGQYELARVSLRTALHLDPDDEWAAEELAEITTPEPPLAQYDLGDPLWAAAEALAGNRPADALTALEGMETVDAIHRRACAHAAAEDLAGVLAALEELRAQPEGMHRIQDLWFFLPPRLWRDVRLWRCLQRLPLMSSGFVPCDREYLPTRTASELSDQERIRLQLRALGEDPG